MLRVDDGAGAAKSTGPGVNILANNAPRLGSYATATVIAGGSTVVTPDAVPADEGSLTNLSVTAAGFAGTLGINPATGIVSIGNAAPVGTFTISVTATDNCGATTVRSFTLDVLTAVLPPDRRPWGSDDFRVGQDNAAD
ncbi:MAG TPA: hypothetical protein VNQ79_01410 [Blastocatellia bacterium]|nr:hypothetical protein [Blastocatellia bacterium]